MIKSRIKNNKGLTLIGVMISLNIMTVGLIALLTLVNSTLIAAFNVRSNIEANALLYDAFESVRNIRDNNLLDKTREESGYDVWDNGFENNGSYTISCGEVSCDLVQINSQVGTLIEPNETTASEYHLYKQADTGIINHDSTNDPEYTRYYRQVIIKDPCDLSPNLDPYPVTCATEEDANLKQAIVYITWRETDGGIRSIIGYTYIGNWNVDEV